MYHLAIKAEREVQGRKQHQTFRSNNGRSFQQRSEPETLTPVFSSGVSKLSNVQPTQLKKGVTPGASTSSSSPSAKIICHRCKGMACHEGLPQSSRFIATEDGYVNTSDVEDDLALATNIAADLTEGDQDTETIAIDSVTTSAGYPSLLV